MCSNPFVHLLVTDLDGTLTDSNNVIAPGNLEWLLRASSLGILTAIATGRNLHSSRKVLTDKVPFQYLIFSGGAGLMEWSTQKILTSHVLPRKSVEKLAHFLMDRKKDFMVQEPIPQNHRFEFWQSNLSNPDFQRRKEIYAEFVMPFDPNKIKPASQVIIVEPKDEGPATYETLKRELSDFAVVRTTSPLDKESIWIEILPQGISKASAAEELRFRLNVPSRQTVAVGNDYNDIDLLDWGTKKFIVDSAPEELRRRYPVVKSFLDACRLAGF